MTPVPGGSKVYIDPPSADIDVGATVTVNVAIEDASNLGAYSFTIEWDPSVLAFVSVSNGSFLGSTARVVVCSSPTVTAGAVAFSCGTLGVTPGPSGDGVLATLTFQGAGQGLSPVHFADVSLDNILGFTVPVTAADGQIKVDPPTPTPTIVPTPTKALVTLAASADGYVFSNNPTQTFGANVLLVVDPLGGGTQRAFLLFDLGALPSGAEIVDAQLRLCLPTSPPSGTVGRQHNLARTTGSWTEGSLTWANQPTVESAVSGSVIVPAAAGCVLFDVKDDVQYWVGGGTNDGWRLSDAAEGGSGANATYGSKENNNAAMRPALTLSYRVP